MLPAAGTSSAPSGRRTPTTCPRCGVLKPALPGGGAQKRKFSILEEGRNNSVLALARGHYVERELVRTALPLHLTQVQCTSLHVPACTAPSPGTSQAMRMRRQEAAPDAMAVPLPWGAVLVQLHNGKHLIKDTDKTTTLAFNSAEEAQRWHETFKAVIKELAAKAVEVGGPSAHTDTWRHTASE